MAKKKPESSQRKRLGAFYTPQYIVEYIVDKTVGVQLEGKHPDDVKDFSVLDPSCGAGSFLLGAYDKLLEWHCQYYVNHDPKEWEEKSRIQQNNGNWRLTYNERVRILYMVYGVDIDYQAVELSKLCLILRLLNTSSPSFPVLNSAQ